jgi:hypothetical protein
MIPLGSRDGRALAHKLGLKLDEPADLLNHGEVALSSTGGARGVER